jgi:hypothetical protein
MALQWFKTALFYFPPDFINCEVMWEKIPQKYSGLKVFSGYFAWFVQMFLAILIQYNERSSKVTCSLRYPLKAIPKSQAFKRRLKASMVFASLILSGILFQRNGPEAENQHSPKLVLIFLGRE